MELAIFHCKCSFGNVKMSIKTPIGLDLYPRVDHRQMKVIDVENNVRMGYWASKNSVQEYKMYAIVICKHNISWG